jgi:lipopolysaccharide transport system ATP-binding protein
MSSNIVIRAEGLGKKYQIAHQARDKYSTLRETLVRSAKGLFKPRSGQTMEEFWALSDVSFAVKQGEALGIIGRNGAGKSTLLKIISRITEPSKGRLELEGRVASLLEVGTGFHPELTGRENILLNGAILGMSQQEIRRKFDEIVEFSGVENFLDTPVKRYSSGMYVRLAFAVAAHLEPEILVIDEVLAVGDAEFQKKCLGKMDDIAKKEGRTILFVSHHMPSILQLCSQALIIERGQIKVQGQVQDIIENYLSGGNQSSVYEPLMVKKDAPVAFERIEILNEANQAQSEFFYHQKIRVKFNLAVQSKNHSYSLFVIVLDQYKRRVFAAETPIKGAEAMLEIEKHFLVRGNFSIHAFIHLPRVLQIDVAEDVCSFVVLDSGSEFSKHENYDYGVIFGRYQWL